MSAQIPFSVVTKPTGAACNLDCQYCFFLSKELLYDAAAQTMSEETLERYVQSFLESSGDGEVTMLWQGGGPTLRGLGFSSASWSCVSATVAPPSVCVMLCRRTGRW